MVLDYVKLKDIKPVLTGYIADSSRLLKKSPFPDDDAVHDIRVLMKKSRSVMKLLVTHLDEESYNREYSAFREAGRILCSFRDTSVHRRTLKGLKKDNPKLFARLNAYEKINMLLKKSELPAEVPESVTSSIENIETLLNKSSFRIRFYTLDKLDPRLLLKELDKSYSLVGQLYLECRNIPKPARLHEFRKKVKDLLYQLYFFRPLNPSAIKDVEKRLDNLTQNLGRYNDLTQVLNAIEYSCSNPENDAALNELAIIIKEKQDEYLSKVWPAAYKMFCPGQQLVNLLGFKILVI